MINPDSIICINIPFSNQERIICCSQNETILNIKHRLRTFLSDEHYNSVGIIDLATESGTVLEDEKTLEDCGVTSNITLYIRILSTAADTNSQLPRTSSTMNLFGDDPRNAEDTINVSDASYFTIFTPEEQLYYKQRFDTNTRQH